jgi:ring-1,2-phenylacetyl-CoA epoxidase subunit PaaB
MRSFDPRINRINLPEQQEKLELKSLDEWETYEVFHQKKRGDQHTHVGIVHAPDPDLALMFAKEQFGRRRITSNLWVVKSSEILATDYDDADIFETTPEKTYREASDYYCLDRIRSWQKEHGIEDRKEQRRKAKEENAK